MCIRTRSETAFTLVELMVATAVAGIVLTALAMFSFYTSRSFAALTNYTKLGRAGQLALDKLSREIRQASQVTAYTTNSLMIINASGNSVQFLYNPTDRSFSRISLGRTNQYLTNCSSLQFSIFQHTAISNTFDCYDTALVGDARLVQVTWSCSENILGKQATTESVESAKIAIRNH